MIIEDKEEIGKAGRKQGLNSVERYLLDIEDEKQRLQKLLDLEDDKQAGIELSELRAYGVKAVKTNSLSTTFNKVFITGELALIAKPRKDRLIVQKTDMFNIETYGKADRKAMSDEHTDLLKKELEKIKVTGVVKGEKPKKRGKE